MNKKIEGLEKSIKQNRDAYRSSKDVILADESLSEKGKFDQIDQLYKEALTRHEDLLGQRQKAIVEFGESKKKKLFSLNGRSTPADQLAFDDAVQRFKGGDISGKELQSRLESGSKITQKAIAKAAFETNKDSLFDQWVTKNPEVYEDAQALVDYQYRYGSRQSKASKMNDNMFRSFPKL